MSEIPEEQQLQGTLVTAYETALYRVDAAPSPFVLRIGERSEPLAALHATHGVDCSAFVTAWNPFSVLQSDAQNRSAQARLERQLAALGYITHRGAGMDPAGAWPGEESVLVLAMPRQAAVDIGRAFGQNAVVWCGPAAVPELVMLGGRGRRNPP